MTVLEKQRLCRDAIQSANLVGTELAKFANELDAILGMPVTQDESARLVQLIDFAKQLRISSESLVHGLRKFVMATDGVNAQ